ncbi:MAG: TetR/AcrR family transcriptional regulator [Lachnospiraceae bacterium]|nr:TetR/AcrR family transcriptional regulator [Lachnospiraceae bacterium]
MNPTQNPSALRSKKAITESLLLLMKQYPYTEITVKQILLETDISRKTFYRNFLSKDDVLNSFIDTILQDYVNTIQQQQQNFSLIKTLDIIFDFCERNKEILFILQNNRLLYLLLEKLNSLILNEHMKYNSEFQENHLKSQLLTEYIIYFNIGGIWNLIVRWIENNMCDSVADIKKSVVFYLSNIGKTDIRDI